MKMRWMTLWSVIAMAALLLPGRAPATAAGPAAPQGGLTEYLYLPLISRGFECPTTSNNTYGQGPVYQWDNDDPVRPAWNHADKNISLRSYNLNQTEAKTLVSYTADPNEPNKPPQIGTMFNPDRTNNGNAGISNVYRINGWDWGSGSPFPGTRGSEVTNPGVTVLGLQTTPGEALQSPTHGRSIGIDFGNGTMVMYADADTVALKFSRADSAAPGSGYTMHIDNICTDPALLALYNSLDNTARNTYYGTPDLNNDYDLPGLTAGQVFGTARDTEIRVAVVDSGSYLDPRSCWELWHWVMPGMGGNCN